MKKIVTLAGLALASTIAGSANAQLVAHKDLSVTTAVSIAQTAVQTCKSQGYNVSAHVLGRAGEVLDPNARKGFFLYGGQGDSRPVSPPGVRFSRLFGGRSMLCGSARVTLAEDDFVFLRPTESEGTFLQFGDIAVYDGQEIAAWWPTFAVAA